MHAIIACQLLTTTTILITMIPGKSTLNSLKYLFYLQYWLKSRNERLKQTLNLAITKNCFNQSSFCPTYGKSHAYAYLYPIIIQFDEETIQLM